MTISVFKYHCALREDGTLVSTYGEFFEDLFEKYLIPLEMSQQCFHLGLYSLQLIIKEI